MNKSCLNQYNSVDLESRIINSSPDELVDLLLQEARTNIAVAKGHMERQNIAQKGEYVGRSLNLLVALRAILDHEKGGEVVANLDSLYGYAQTLLLRGTLHNSIDMLTEAAGLLNEIHTGWKRGNR